MKNPLRLMALAFLVLGLNGCGLKGPLFYPPADKAAVKPLPARTVTPTPARAASPNGASPTPAAAQP